VGAVKRSMPAREIIRELTEEAQIFLRRIGDRPAEERR